MGYPSTNKTYMQTKYNVTKCANRRKNKAVKYIVVHYTGTTASAKNNCIYFSGGNRNASADYFVDTNGSIYKFNGDCANYYSWHCGDGYGKYGITNANSIGIECVSAGKEFTAKQQAALRNLVQAIMADYGVKAANVVRHYDASRKSCPAPYCGSTKKNKKWTTLKSYLTKKTGTKKATTKSTTTNTSSKSYKVKVTADVLNVRKTARANAQIVGTVKKGEVYTIVGESKVGSVTWLKLKSGVGYICGSYVKKV